MKPYNCMNRKSSGLFKDVIKKICLEIIYSIYMDKKDSALKEF